jgi:hypothetical protein
MRLPVVLDSEMTPDPISIQITPEMQAAFERFRVQQQITEANKVLSRQQRRRLERKAAKSLAKSEVRRFRAVLSEQKRIAK